MNTVKEQYRHIFDTYTDCSMQIECDIRFWRHFLNESIEKYRGENPINRWISQSGFAIYNWPVDGSPAWLHSSPKTATIEIDDLVNQSNSFFVWIMNLSLIRLYNATELLLIQTIQNRFFPDMKDPSKGKKEMSKVNVAIKTFLKNQNLESDTKNNRHIIEYLKSNCNEFNQFLSAKVNPINWNTSWQNYFELISILRNVIAHHSMLITANTRNEINSIAGDIFLFYFSQPISKKEQTLKPKDEDSFLNFIHHINDFSGNAVKYIAGEQDFEFIGLYAAPRIIF